jgi:hypothetical protein
MIAFPRIVLPVDFSEQCSVFCIGFAMLRRHEASFFQGSLATPPSRTAWPFLGKAGLLLRPSGSGFKARDSRSVWWMLATSEAHQWPELGVDGRLCVRAVNKTNPVSCEKRPTSAKSLWDSASQAGTSSLAMQLHALDQESSPSLVSKFISTVFGRVTINGQFPRIEIKNSAIPLAFKRGRSGGQVHSPPTSASPPDLTATAALRTHSKTVPARHTSGSHDSIRSAPPHDTRAPRTVYAGGTSYIDLP